MQLLIELFVMTVSPFFFLEESVKLVSLKTDAKDIWTCHNFGHKPFTPTKGDS